MKKTLVITVCMAAMVLHGITPEERKQIVRDSIPQLIKLTDNDLWGVAGYVFKLSPEEALAEFYEILQEKMDDRATAFAVVDAFLWLDGHILESKGERKALDWTRKIVEKHGPSTRALEYLVLKGNAEDLLFLKDRDSAKHALLEKRMSGVNFFKPQGMLYTGRRPGFIPSAANTGPQAIYAYEILKHAWEDADKDDSCIPPELLTMVVSFDQNGKPACSVDIARYGLSMPVITSKPNPHLPGKTKHVVTFPYDDEVKEQREALRRQRAEQKQKSGGTSP